MLLYHERISRLESIPHTSSAMPITAADIIPNGNGVPHARAVSAATVVAGNRGLGTAKRCDIGHVFGSGHALADTLDTTYLSHILTFCNLFCFRYM